MGIEYTLEKMDKIVDGLAKNPDPLPARLGDVYIPLASAITDAELGSHLPADVLDRLKAVVDQVLRLGVVGHRNPADPMSTEEASDVARELVELRHKVLQIAGQSDAI